MAMANLFLNTPSIDLPPKPTKKSRFPFQNPLISSVAVSPSRRRSYLHAVEPISSLIKENSGLIGNRNRSDSSGSNSYLFWEIDRKENKLKCNWRKAGAVADPEEDTQSKRTNINKSQRKSRGKLQPNKLYTIVVGASFCIVLGLYSLKKLPMPHRTPSAIDVPYSNLVWGIQEGSVTRVQFVEDSRQIYFNTNKNSIPTAITLANRILFPKWQYQTRNVEDDKYDLLRMLKDKGVVYGSNKTLLSAPMKNFLFIFFQVAPFWMMVLLTCYQLSIQQDFGKLTKKKPSKKQSVTFDDVKGVDAAKAELLEIVLCMKGDNRYIKLGAKLPRGVLLTGPPGTGKTLLARAVAGEAGVSFFSISASELVEVFVGRGAARVRDLFREAKKNSPSIVFIDEIDAVGGQRGRTLNCERDQTLNQLLTNMDGFDKEESVVVIAATNRPETLDSALMRPGRFSRKVRVGAPDETGRKEIFEFYLKDVPMEDDDKEDISENVASLTPGFVGADLENIAREAVLLAARRGGEFVKKEDILEAVSRAKGHVYEHEPFTFRPAANEGGPQMGFGFAN